MQARRSQLVVIAIVAAVLLGVLLWMTAESRNGAEADTPHPGLSMGIGVDANGDTTNDCGTGVPSAVGVGAGEPADPAVPVAEVSNTTCPATTGTLQVNVYLMTGDIAYEATAALVYYTGGITSNETRTTHWKCHSFDAGFSGVGFESAGSTIGLSAPCNVGQTNLGLMHRFSFACAGGGTFRLGYGVGETELFAPLDQAHNETGPDVVAVCGAVLEPTPTPTVCLDCATATPTNTPLPSSTLAPTNTPTFTPTPTVTPTPTRTRTPTITPTSTVTSTPTRRRPVSTLGDVDGDGFITSLDALWVLQYDAGLVAGVPIPEAADMNRDGAIDSLDAQFILWVDGGIILAL